MAILSLFCLFACSAVVPLASSINDNEEKEFKPVAGKSKIYVVRTCDYGGKLHDVSLNGSTRVSLGCQNYTVFLTEPGEQKLSFFSTENREFLVLSTEKNSNYFVEMSWNIGSGTGDVRVTASVLDDYDGMKSIMNAQLISLDGY